MDTTKIRDLTSRLDQARTCLSSEVKIGYAVRYFPSEADAAIKELEGTPLEGAARAVFQAICDYRKAELVEQMKEVNRIEALIRAEVGIVK